MLSSLEVPVYGNRNVFINRSSSPFHYFLRIRYNSSKVAKVAVTQLICSPILHLYREQENFQETEMGGRLLCIFGKSNTPRLCNYSLCTMECTEARILENVDHVIAIDRVLLENLQLN